MQVIVLADFMIFQSRLSLGLYVFFLEHWMREFPRNQIFVVRLEDYSADKKRSLRDIAQFLDLGKLKLYLCSHCETYSRIFAAPWPSNVLNSNSIKRKWNRRHPEDQKIGEMRNDTRRLLTKFFHPYNVRLSRLLDDKRFLWWPLHFTYRIPLHCSRLDVPNVKKKNPRSKRTSGFFNCCAFGDLILWFHCSIGHFTSDNAEIKAYELLIEPHLHIYTAHSIKGIELNLEPKV